MMSITAAFLVFAVGMSVGGAQAQDNSGTATYSNTNGGVCPASSTGLPGVSMNAAQFGGGSACGQCIQIQGNGNGAGQNPVSQAPYIAVVTNVCPQCAPGDIDLQESGDGRFGVTWSFVACPGSGRKLIETEVEEAVEEAASPAVAEVAVESTTEDSRMATAEVAVGESAEETIVEQPEATPVDGVIGEAAAPSIAADLASPAAAQPLTSRKLLRSSSSSS